MSSLVGKKRPRELFEAYESLKSLRMLSEEMISLKTTNTEVDQETLEALRDKMKLVLILLKQQNRIAHFDTQEHKEMLNEQHDELSNLKQQLNNFAFEKASLRREINQCRNYKSCLDDFELIDESFIPEEQRNGITDNHELIKLRLNAELTQRKKLLERIDELKKKKKKLETKNQQEKSFFQGIESYVDQLKQIVEPLQDKLSGKMNVLDANSDLAQKLPPSLYVIYYQGVVYASEHSNILTVSILGNIDEANDWLQKRSRGEDDDLSLFVSHPLSIQFVIKPTDPSLSQVTICFRYLHVLEIITVVENDTDKRYSKQFLSCLFPGDTGLLSPNPSTSSKLPNLYQFSSPELGKPYIFAQQLAGLKVLTEEIPHITKPFKIPSNSLAPRQIMEVFIDSVCFRLEAFNSLAIQIKGLSKGKPIDIPGYTLHSKSKISSCSKITKEQYIQRMNISGNTQQDHLKYEDKKQSTFLKLIVSSMDNRTNEILIFISPSYPSIPPMITLVSNSKSSNLPEFVKNSSDPSTIEIGKNSGVNQQLFEEMERKLNNEGYGIDRKQRILLLTIQVYKLLHLFGEYYNN